MSKIVSIELHEALLDQWVEEKTNAHIYYTIGAWLKNKGLDNLGKKFLDGAFEEDEHAKQILDLMTDLNIPFFAKDIPLYSGVSECREVVEIFLLRETQTTDSLNELKNISIEENPIIEEFARKMIHQQQAEMEEAYSFRDKFEMTGGDMRTILLWDLSLGGK